MIKATISPANKKKVIVGPVRLSYCHLFQKYSPDGNGDGKYQTSILIPKNETEAVKVIMQAMDNAKQDAKSKKWGGSVPLNLASPLKDGDKKPIKAGSSVPDPTFKDCWYINAKSDKRPGIVDREKQPIMDEEEVYSGMWAYVSISFFGYRNSGNCGISASLENVMKYKDGERLGGKASAEEDFVEINDTFDDDDDL